MISSANCLGQINPIAYYSLHIHEPIKTKAELTVMLLKKQQHGSDMTWKESPGKNSSNEQDILR